MKMKVMYVMGPEPMTGKKDYVYVGTMHLYDDRVSQAQNYVDCFRAFYKSMGIQMGIDVSMIDPLQIVNVWEKNLESQGFRIVEAIIEISEAKPLVLKEVEKQLQKEIEEMSPEKRMEMMMQVIQQMAKNLKNKKATRPSHDDEAPFVNPFEGFGGNN